MLLEISANLRENGPNWSFRLPFLFVTQAEKVISEWYLKLGYQAHGKGVLKAAKMTWSQILAYQISWYLGCK